jgi:hypothetical protein
LKSGIGAQRIPDYALRSCTGNENVGVGHGAGGVITTGNDIIAIGAGVSGISSVFGEVDNSCYIGNISGASVDPGSDAFVFVDADGKLGTVTVDANGNKIEGVQPQAMLRKIEELQATVAQQQKQIEALTAGLQKVSAQLELKKLAPQTVKNND